MKKRLLSAVMIISMAAVALAGCGGSGASETKAAQEAAGTAEAGEQADAGAEKTGAEEGKSYTIATVVKDMSDPWCLRHQEGVDEYAKATGHNCYVKGPSKTDSAEQIQVIETLIEQDIDAICVVPIDPEACKPALAKAREKGIVVITHEAEGFDECDYDLEAFNNTEYGEAMMDELAKAMGEEGQYVTMVAFLSSTSHNQWMDAAVAHQKANYPNMELIPEERIECEDNMDMAYNKSKEIIKKYPEIKGFIGASSYDPPGAAKAIDELGMTGKIFAVGTGVPSVSGPYLESGSNPCVLCWDPALSGEAMCELAVMVLNGEKDKIATGFDLGIDGYGSINVNGTDISGSAILTINKDNMGDYQF